MSNKQIIFSYNNKKNFIKAEDNLDEFIDSIKDECDIELKDNEIIILKNKNGKIINNNDIYEEYLKEKKTDETIYVEVVDKNEQEKLKQEELEKEKLKQEELEKEKLKQEELEKEKLKQEKLEKKKLKQEKLEKEKLKQEKLEKEKLKQEKLEKEKLEMKSKKKNKTNIPTNNDEDTIERRIHNESNTNDDKNIGNYNEIDRNGNELEKNNSNQILIEIEKIFEQKIKIINDKIEKEKNERMIEYSKINEKIDNFTKTFNESIKQIETKFNYLEKKQSSNNSFNINQSNNENINQFLKQISEELNGKINNIKTNYLSELNNIYQKIDNKSNSLQNQINNFINEIKSNISNISNKINQNKNIKIETNNKNELNEGLGLNNNNMYDNNIINNKGINQNSNKKKYINIDTDKGEMNTSSNNYFSVRERGYNMQLILSNNKIKTRLEDLKSGKTKINIEIKNIGNAPLPNKSYFKGEGDNLYIAKTPLKNPIYESDNFQSIVQLKNNAPQKNETIIITLYDPNNNELVSCDLEIEISGIKNKNLVENNDVNNFDDNNSELMKSMDRRRDLREKLNQIKGFFPDKDENELFEALNKCNGNLEEAVNLIMEK